MTTDQIKRAAWEWAEATYPGPWAGVTITVHLPGGLTETVCVRDTQWQRERVRRDVEELWAILSSMTAEAEKKRRRVAEADHPPAQESRPE